LRAPNDRQPLPALDVCLEPNQAQAAGELRRTHIRVEIDAQGLRELCECHVLSRVNGVTAHDLSSSWTVADVPERPADLAGPRSDELRGFHFVAAVTFVAEIGDARRFARPRALMAYLGLVPSESSSGQTRHQGSITKTGNKHARRILIEAAWNYRHSARISRILEVRQQGQLKIVRDISWRAQLRLTQRFRHLAMSRRMPRNKVNVAIARELAGFIWDIARQVNPLA
jgi:hypothetical protein